MTRKPITLKPMTREDRENLIKAIGLAIPLLGEFTVPQMANFLMLDIKSLDEALKTLGS